MLLKICPKCQIEKLSNEFFRDKSNKDGCDTYCKKCKQVSTIKTRNKFRENHIKNGINLIGEKQCNKCKKVKPRTEFTVNMSRKDGLSYHCKLCSNAETNLRRIQYRKNNKNQPINIVGSKRCCICKEVLNKTEFYKDKSKSDGLANCCKKCGSVKNKILKYVKYGITFDIFNSMLKEQNNKCQICGIELINPTVDHNHTTGKVRGILCNNCNSGIGFFKESIEFLQKAQGYLIKYNS